MPKVVDHEERRAEIVRALWRVIARSGMDAASVRTVAAEAGWSLGAIRYYFTTQDELIRFAAEAMLTTAEQRVLRILDAREPGPARCRELVEQLLPMDPERTAEVRVWLAMVVRASVDPVLDDLRLLAWQSERELCRLVVREIRGLPPRPRGSRLSSHEERLAAELQTVVDGLSLQAATVPEQLPASRARTALRRHLDRLRGE
jgi:AcrR family transcriptional regulator